MRGIARTLSTSTEHYAHAGLTACSHMVHLAGGHQLHVRQIVQADDGRSKKRPVAMLLHGALANGRMFYSDKALGLGPFLARRGFNVFVPDLRGRGRSTPSIASEPSHSMHASIVEDLPAIVCRVAELSGRKQQSWAAHSWGGVLLQAALARDHQFARDHCESLTLFGTKKHISAPQTWRERRDYLTDITLGWRFLCPLIARRYGYLPARQLGIGGDDETQAYVEDSGQWVDSTNEEWVDPTDGFDYLAAHRALGDAQPPTWHIAAANDTVRGNPRDVQSWASATGSNRQGTDQFTVLSHAAGNLEDYDHNSMLLSKLAPKDTHFDAVADWMLRHSAQAAH